MILEIYRWIMMLAMSLKPKPSVLLIKDHSRKTKALETFFILQYDGVDNGYNATYNYPSAERAYEIVENNAEYIINCLRKNGIRFKLQCSIEDVVEIAP